MAVAITKPTDLKRVKGWAGPLKITVWDVAFSGSYAATGETITPSQVNLNSIIAVIGLVKEAAAATSGIPAYWNNSTSKLQLYESAASGSPLGEKGAEAYAASTTGRLTFIGT